MASTHSNDSGTADVNESAKNDAPLDKNIHQTSSPHVQSEANLQYPKSVFFIISNEFCERFNYYGMRAVLVLYFTQKLKFDNTTATVLYHLFTAAIYFMCIFGALLSDSLLGKFRTIMYLSLVYAMGSVVVALGSVPTLNMPKILTTGIGLLLIAIGSGGIKPCAAPFGGDQFRMPAQFMQMASFFSIHYFTINAASLISTFVTPIFRQDFHCFSESDCFSLAFGVPGALMLIAIVLFVCGKPMYRIHPPAGNMLFLVTKCIKHAIVTRSRERVTHPREHWLEYAETKYGPQLVADIKILLKVLVLYIPLPFFWSLFDQQGSRWTLQAQNMNGDIGFYTIKPDQMHFLNPLLVVVFIPFCDSILYPLLGKIGIRRPLHKVALGMFLVTVAFLLSGFVEVHIEKYSPRLPTEGEANLRFINGLPCNFTARTNISQFEKFNLNQFTMIEKRTIRPTKYEFALTSKNPECPRRIQRSILLESRNAKTIFVSGNGSHIYNEFIDDSRNRRTPLLRILFSSLRHRPERMATTITSNRTAFIDSFPDRRLRPISSGVHDVYVGDQKYGAVSLKKGSVSTLIIFETANEEIPFELHLVEITAPKTLSMLWLVPQYVVVSLGEVMFTVTGASFTYAQAPKSMKSVLHAIWLLNIAFGNVIIIAIAGARIFQKQSNEFFLFTGLTMLNVLFFMVLAKNYKNENVDDSVVDTQHSTDESQHS